MSGFGSGRQASPVEVREQTILNQIEALDRDLERARENLQSAAEQRESIQNDIQKMEQELSELDPPTNPGGIPNASDLRRVGLNQDIEARRETLQRAQARVNEASIRLSDLRDRQAPERESLSVQLEEVQNLPGYRDRSVRQSERGTSRRSSGFSSSSDKDDGDYTPEVEDEANRGFSSSSGGDQEEEAPTPAQETPAPEPTAPAPASTPTQQAPAPAAPAPQAPAAVAPPPATPGVPGQQAPAAQVMAPQAQPYPQMAAPQFIPVPVPYPVPVYVPQMGMGMGMPGMMGMPQADPSIAMLAQQMQQMQQAQAPLLQQLFERLQDMYQQLQDLIAQRSPKAEQSVSPSELDSDLEDQAEPTAEPESEAQVDGSTPESTSPEAMTLKQRVDQLIARNVIAAVADHGVETDQGRVLLGDRYSVEKEGDVYTVTDEAGDILMTFDGADPENPVIDSQQMTSDQRMDFLMVAPAEVEIESEIEAPEAELEEEPDTPEVESDESPVAEDEAEQDESQVEVPEAELQEELDTPEVESTEPPVAESEAELEEAQVEAPEAELEEEPDTPEVESDASPVAESEPEQEESQAEAPEAEPVSVHDHERAVHGAYVCARVAREHGDRQPPQADGAERFVYNGSHYHIELEGDQLSVSAPGRGEILRLEGGQIQTAELSPEDTGRLAVAEQALDAAPTLAPQPEMEPAR